MRSFYFKIALAFSAILILFGLLVAFITMRATTDLAQEAIQTTNRDLAPRLSAEFNPILSERFNQEEIEQKLAELSGTNPQFDFYLLNSDGRIKSQIPSGQSGRDLEGGTVDTRPLDAFITGESLPILAVDPMNPDQIKPFSAAPISIMGSEGCYLYVVLEGEQFSRTAALISDSYIVRTTLILIGFVFLLTLAVGLYTFSTLTRRLGSMKEVVKRFERGELDQRVEVVGRDELTDLSSCFNRMADTLVANMEEIRRSDRMRRELVANVSHDLRSPVASIQGYLETIQLKGDSIDRDEFREYLETVVTNTRQLNRLIDDLFELSRLDAEEVTPRLEPVSMAELVQDLVQQFRPIAEKKGVNLNVEFPDDPHTLIQADIALMNRVLTNLIDNAITHTPSGGTVTVSSTRKGQDLVIEVTDTGSGIPREDLPHIFERFYQVDKSRSAGNGAGLGLAIARKIVHLHGARMDVKSLESQGTTFSIALSTVGS